MKHRRWHDPQAAPFYEDMHNLLDAERSACQREVDLILSGVHTPPPHKPPSGIPFAAEVRILGLCVEMVAKTEGRQWRRQLLDQLDTRPFS